MAITTLTEDVGDFIGTACRWPTLDAPNARSAVLQGRRAKEDFTVAAALMVRRHPSTVVGAAVLAG